MLKSLASLFRCLLGVYLSTHILAISAFVNLTKILNDSNRTARLCKYQYLSAISSRSPITLFHITMHAPAVEVKYWCTSSTFRDAGNPLINIESSDSGTKSSFMRCLMLNDICKNNRLYRGSQDKDIVQAVGSASISGTDSKLVARLFDLRRKTHSHLFKHSFMGHTTHIAPYTSM